MRTGLWRNGVARQTFAYDGYAFPLLLTLFLHEEVSFLPSELPTTFDAVVVVWARFAVERRAALRKLILPTISSCLHWFGRSENPVKRFLSQLHIRHTKTHPAFAPIALPSVFFLVAARTALLPIARVHGLLKKHPLEIHMIPYTS